MVGLEPGSLFAGRYEIIRSLGAGGMGAVYLACDPLDRAFQVALKVLYPGALESVQARQRFRNEISASYKVNHPNVVKAYEYFDAEDMQAYAMEFVDGGDLMDRMLGNTLSPDEAVTIVKQIASALTAVHAAGIIHRDLKPENILMTKRGEVKLSDFGVARLRDGQTLTQADSMVGTPKYLAPEYVETGECDNRGDIFALGVIAYEMLSGRSPFGKNFKSDQLLERLTMEIPPLDVAAPACPPALARIIEKAMSVRLSKRYQNADALLQDLEAYSRGDFTVKSSKAVQAPVEIEPENEPKPTESRTTFAEPKVDSGFARIQKIADKAKHTSKKRSVGPIRKWVRDHAPLSIAGTLGVFSVIALVGLIGAAGSRFITGSGITSLPEGQYRGIATGVLGEKTRYPFALVRRGRSAWVLFGKRSCAMSPVESNGEFSCGDLRFEINPTSVSGKNAVGSMRETTWGTEGTWTLEAADAPPRPGTTQEGEEIDHSPPKLEELKGLVPLAIGGANIERARVLILSPTGCTVKKMTEEDPNLVARVRSRDLAGRLYQFQIQTKSGEVYESRQYLAEELGARRDAERISMLKSELSGSQRELSELKAKIKSLGQISDSALDTRKDQELAKALLLLREREQTLKSLGGTP